MLSRKHLIPLAFSIVSFAFMLTWVLEVEQAGRVPDFAVFYSAPHLLETGDLYNTQRLHELERTFTGAYSEEHGYLRPPFHALLYWPLSRLSYSTARACWTVVLVLAFAGFIAFWPGPSPMATLMFASLAMPVFAAFTAGQELPLLLLFLAGAAVLLRRGRAFGAGLLLSLCAIKFHLFLLLPLLLIGGKYWRALGGLLAGGSILLAASFAAAGPLWPLLAVRAAMNLQFSPRAALMPNLHGMLAGLSQGWVVEMILSAAVAAAVWVVARRAPFLVALACALTGGLLLSYHAYFVDFAILLPAGLAVLASSRLGVQRLLAALLISPVSYLLLVMGFPYSLPVVLGMLTLVGLSAYEVLRAGAADTERQDGCQHVAPGAFTPTDYPSRSA